MEATFDRRAGKHPDCSESANKKGAGVFVCGECVPKIMRLRSEESAAEKQKIIAISKLKRKLKLYTLLICLNVDTYYGTDIKAVPIRNI